MKSFHLLLVLAALHFSVRLHAAQIVSVAELNYSDPDGGDYDFIELVSLSSTPVSLAGASFTSAIVYTFTDMVPLGPGERIVVVRDRAKFLARYGTGFRVAEGAFGGGFSASGEQVTLVSPQGATWLDFAYQPDGRWPSRANGLGSTLECIDPAGDLNDPDNWRSSAEWLGSPGRAGTGPQRVVVINEVLAHTDPPLEDAIELLNLTDQPVNIGGWYLSDERGSPKKFRIPANTVIPAHGYKVFYELAGLGNAAGFNPDGTGDSPSFTFNSSQGDEAVLLSADAAGNPLFWMDAVSFGATENGYSLGRHPNGTGALTTMSRLTFGTDVTAAFPAEFISVFRTGTGATNADPRVGPVVFNRIQYNPAAGGDEFLELINNSADTVPLYDPAYPTNTWRLRDGVDFDFPGSLALAAGAKLLVVGVDPATFRTKYSVPANIPVLGPWTNVLSNSGETVAVFKPDAPQLPPHPDAGLVPYILVEEVKYSAAAPWPPEANGAGPALRRIDITRFGNDSANWEAEVGTPPSAPVVGVEQNGSGVRLSFAAESGRTYRLEGSNTLGAVPWDNLGNLPTPPAGGPFSVDVVVPGSLRFFRVAVE